MILRCTESIWPHKPTLDGNPDAYPWITASVDPHKVVAIIPHGETGCYCPPGEEVCTILFDSGFRWGVRARSKDWDQLRAAMGPGLEAP